MHSSGNLFTPEMSAALEGRSASGLSSTKEAIREINVVKEKLEKNIWVFKELQSAFCDDI